MNNRFCDFIVSYYKYFLLTALLFFLAQRFLDIPATISAFAAASLGAAGGMFGRYAMERGLWMASTLFLLIICFTFFPLLISVLLGFRKNLDAGILMLIDEGIGFGFFAIQIIFLSIVTYKNAKI